MAKYQGQLLMGNAPRFYSNKFHWKDKIAIIDEESQITWQQLNTRVNKLANRLLRLGIKKDDKVAILLYSRIEYVEILYALGKIGAVAVNLNYNYTPRELEYTLNFSDVVKIFVSKDFISNLMTAIKDIERINNQDIILLDDGDRAIHQYEKLITDSVSDEPDVEVLESDPFYIAFTGGTTGPPKAAVIRHRNIFQSHFGMSVDYKINDKDIYLSSGPFYHGLSFVFGLATLQFGGTLVMLKKFDAEKVLQMIQKHKVTFSAMVPTMYNMIINTPGKEKYNISSIRLIISAGSPLLSNTKNAIIEFFKNAEICEQFSATEGGPYTILKHQDIMRKHRCCGEPAFGVEIKLLDDKGNEVPAGEIGEFYKKGNITGGEYYKNSKATADLKKGDWVRSGDMGYKDEEGYFYVVDRKKDMIISGGVNIFPSEIEDIIQNHSKVKEVAVIGVPDEHWGESIKAIVVKKDESVNDEELENELLELCKVSLIKYKKPRSFEFWDELPKSGAGKILKRKIRDMYWKDIEERV
ncbi:class I adenylate-forming enzyme family protein [Bacillus dakarensis]|uniref:class I adenylate-forming enzyme family protein n=1 Tax=Robertmurraya dakarensis TaxID=1926278 RepID=UPI000982166D|nr:class I adenylate-forming enzyme family protein [Bacillus dakarensis]